MTVTKHVPSKTGLDPVWYRYVNLQTLRQNSYCQMRKLREQLGLTSMLKCNKIPYRPTRATCNRATSTAIRIGIKLLFKPAVVAQFISQ